MSEGKMEPMTGDVDGEDAPPADENLLVHDLGGVMVTPEGLVLGVESIGDGRLRIGCALCQWTRTGPEEVVQAFGQYHVDVLHRREMGAIKKSFVQQRAEYKRRVEQSKADRKRAREKKESDLEKAKKEYVQKLEEHEADMDAELAAERIAEGAEAVEAGK